MVSLTNFRDLIASRAVFTNQRSLAFRFVEKGRDMFWDGKGQGIIVTK